MVQVLASLSEALAETVATASSGVVQVVARDRIPASGIVWSADGIIVTAHHVVERDENLGVGLPNGRTVPATLVGRDPTTDLAVLRAEVGGLLQPAARAESNGLRVGHLVVALGRPGEVIRATLGIVSVLGEAWRTPMGGRLDRYLQTDVAMYPGFSGGPLVDVTGRVLGLNTSALLRGVSLTVPVPTLGRVVDTLLTQGRIRRGYLGVGAQPVRLPAAIAQQVGQETGLLLVSVDAGSPAEGSGLIIGDTLVTLDGERLRHMDDLLALLNGDRAGAAVRARILRGGQVQDLTVTIGERS